MILRGGPYFWTRIFALLSWLAIGCAKPPDFPEFKGHVVDQAGNAVPGALVKLIKIADNRALTAPIDYAVSDGNGDFDFSETDLGHGKNFVLVVSKQGYDPDAQEVSLGENRSPKKRDAFVLNESTKN